MKLILILETFRIIAGLQKMGIVPSYRLVKDWDLERLVLLLTQECFIQN